MAMTKSTTNQTTQNLAEVKAEWELITLLRENFADEYELKKLTEQFQTEILPLADKIDPEERKQFGGTFTTEAGLAAVKEWLGAVRTAVQITEPDR